MRDNDLIPVLLPFGKTIYQTSNGQPITSDTASFVQTILDNEENNSQKILELGTGNGIIALMLSYYRPTWKITAFDIQEKLINLAKKNASEISQQISFVVDDIKNLKNIRDDNYDLIVGNPPYFQVNSSRISPIYERAISRSEILCKMNDVLVLIKNRLAESGKAYLIYPESRLKEFENNLKRVNFEIVNLTILENAKRKFFIAEFKNA